MIRGLCFQIPNSYDSYLNKILYGINIENYNWKIVEDQVLIKGGFLFSADTYNGKSFSKRISYPSYLVFFINLQAYTINGKHNDILTYEDFIKSNCEIIVLITDAIFVDIYAKDINVIQRIKSNAETNNFTKLQFITDENDIRKEFQAI